MKKFVPFLLAVLLFPTEIQSQSLKEFFHSDTISHKRFSHNSALYPAIGLGLTITGSMLADDHTNQPLPTGYQPAFSCKADEVLRFVPAIALVGMKAFGVESRTPWGRMLISDAMSVGIMGVAIESTKQLSKRNRPDGSNNRSFPSGHTAAAFMTATMFAKEYGWRSPWYSIGAYTVATSTAMLRRVNDKHWMSDVVVGAGIGILSTELGYAITDLIYRDKTVPTTMEKAYVYDQTHRPHFFMPYLSIGFPNAMEGRVTNHRIRSRQRWNAGIEGAYFLSPHMGFGGRMGISSGQLSVDDTTEERPLDFVSVSAGPYFSYPLLNNFLAGVNIRGGYGLYPDAPLSVSQITLGGTSGWTAGGGASLTYLSVNGLQLRLMVDYEHWPSATKGNKLNADLWSVGFGMNVSL